MGEIAELMLGEHGKINNFLKRFEESLIENKDVMKNVFVAFHKELDKHFFLEEQAIFGLHSKITGEEVGDIFDLMKEHGEIKEIVNNIYDGIKKGVKPGIDLLKGSVNLLLVNKH